MIEKTKAKEKAIELREKGLSYKDILKEIPVAKSSLSLWLRAVKLSKLQEQKLVEKRIKSALMGAEKRRQQRIYITKKIKEEAKREVGKLSKREIWLIGIALYWAEGKKERNKCSLVDFSNSDP